MSLPSRSESFSNVLYSPDADVCQASLALGSLRCGVATASFTSEPLPAPTSCCSPSWSLRALRRLLAGAATNARTRLAPRSCARWIYLSSSAAPSGFRTPSTLLSATCRPALFHAGTVLGLPSLRRFLPDRSPRDLSVLGVLLAVCPLARPRLRGCQHRSDALTSLA